MKKLLLSFSALFLFFAITNAQDAKTENLKRNFLALTAGPSFPVGDFASTDLDNDDAGLAKTGFTIDLKYGHHFNNVFGLTAAAIYGRYAVDKSAISDDGTTGLSIDPWQYYGILAGPLVTGGLSRQAFIDFSVLSGAVLTAFPKSTLDGIEVTKRDWSTAVPIKFAADLRFGFNNAGYIFVGGSYMYMKPKFNVTAKVDDDFETTRLKQKMGMFGANAGIGITF